MNLKPTDDRVCLFAHVFQLLLTITTCVAQHYITERQPYDSAFAARRLIDASVFYFQCAPNRGPASEQIMKDQFSSLVRVWWQVYDPLISHPLRTCQNNCASSYVMKITPWPQLIKISCTSTVSARGLVCVKLWYCNTIWLLLSTETL